MPVSLVLVDEHTIFRNILSEFLRSTTNFEILGEADNGVDALALVEQLHPDVVVLDYLPPLINGAEVAFSLRQRQPGIHLVVLSFYHEWNYVALAIRSGACGYVLKEDTGAHLEKAVLAAAAGQTYFSPSLIPQPVQSAAAQEDAFGKQRLNIKKIFQGKRE